MKPTDINRVHFIGVGGIGMSALARLCLHEGKKVTGSDAQQSAITEALSSEGVKVTYTHAPENIPDTIDLVVYTEAISKDNEELAAAKKRKIETINYFDALGLFLNDYYLIAISGTHGKTTTTAMVTDIFEAAGLDPTAIIGSLRRKTGSNFRPGTSKYAIVEACEFRRDFLSLKPDVLIITNVEYEHVDYFKNLEDVQKAFVALASQVSDDGAIIANTDDPIVATVLRDVETKANKIDYTQYFDPSFEALAMPGMHNRLNAAAAIAAAQFIGIDVYLARETLKNFEGTWRRFEHKGELNRALVYDDYAHHPTEIRMTLKTVREQFPDKNVIAVFQPHTYSRTKVLFNDFADELSKADEVLLLPIYNARDEENDSDVSSEKLRVTISGKNPNATYFETQDELVAHLRDCVTKNDVLILMGAGDVAKVANTLTGA